MSAPSLEAIRVFVTVIEAGSFRAAAQVLHRSQPALTRMMQNLEQQLGFKLVDRSQYRPQLTEQGQAYFHQARSLLTHSGSLNEYAKHLRSYTELEFTLSIDMLAPKQQLIELYRVLSTAFVHTRFNFLSDSLGGGCDRLKAGAADLAITENLFTNTPNEVQPFAQVNMIPVASPDYLAVNSELLYDAARIQQCLQVVIRNSGDKPEQHSFGTVDGSKQWVVADIHSKKQLIESGVGWGRLPDFLIEKSLAEGRLVAMQANHIDARLLPLTVIRMKRVHYGPVMQFVWDYFHRIKSQCNTSSYI